MKTNILTTMSNTTVEEKKAAEKAEVILLGIDVHAEKQVVVRQIGGQTPQPAQGFSREDLLHWICKQRKLAKEVCSCYEAGPFRYGLHRELERMGVTYRTHEDTHPQVIQPPGLSTRQRVLLRTQRNTDIR